MIGEPCRNCGAALPRDTRPQLCGRCQHEREKAREYLSELHGAARERRDAGDGDA